MTSMVKSFLKTILRYKSLGIISVILMIVVTTCLEVFSVLGASVLVSLLTMQNPTSFESSHWLEQAYLDTFGYQMALMVPLLVLITAPISKIYLFKKYNSTDEIFKKLSKKLKWLKINYGQGLIFTQNILHGNVINKEKKLLYKHILRISLFYSH